MIKFYFQVSTGAAAATTSSTSSPRSKTGKPPKTYSGNGSNTNNHGGSAGSSQNHNQNAQNSPTKSGLFSVADVIHKNEDLSELSEAEQLELVMRESKIDALSPEEQVQL